MPRSSQSCVSDNSHQVHPHQLVAELVLDLRYSLGLHFFYSRVLSSLPSVNVLYIDCTRVSLGDDETIKINDPVLA